MSNKPGTQNGSFENDIAPPANVAFDGSADSAGTMPATRAAASNAKDQAADAGAHAKAAIGDVADQVAEKAAAVAGQVKEHAAAAADSHKSEFADKIDDLAQAAHRSGEQLEGHQDWAAGLIEQGAAQLGNFATTLRSNDLGGLLKNLQQLARDQPLVFTAASLAAGFALVRFGKVAISGLSQDDLPTMPARQATADVSP